MPPPRPIWLYHFTHVEHLPGIIENGLVCDSQVGGLLTQEAGDRGIKERRRRAAVTCYPGGVVADYAPFYFAPRSPMLYRIRMGGVATYNGSQRDLVYLCTTVEQLEGMGLQVVVTDRNAVLTFARFATARAEWSADGFVDWDLMAQRDWYNDEDHPDRKERRMAECLVHHALPWEAVMAIGCFDDSVAESVRATVEQQTHQPDVLVRRQWYF